LKNIPYSWQTALEVGLALACQHIEYLKPFFRSLFTKPAHDGVQEFQFMQRVEGYANQNPLILSEW